MKFFKSGWFKFIIIVVVIILIATIFYFKKDQGTTHRTAVVSKEDIESYVEGSGAIKPGESRKIYAKVSSEIKEVLHEEGDFVNEGEVIAKLDSSSFSSTVDSQRIAIEQATLSYNNIKKQIDDLVIKANASGYVSGLTISEGSYVTNTMQICDITENGVFEITLPFIYSSANMVQVGSVATVYLNQSFTNLEGTVTKVSQMRELGNNGGQVVDVTIKVTTSGYSLAGFSARAEALVNGTRQTSSENGTFVAVSSNVVRAKSMGTVESVNVYDGKYVNAGDIIAVLSNEDLKTNLENAELTLKNLKSQMNSVNDQLDNYTIKTPISGTITVQSLKVGDMVAAGTVISTISNKDVFEFDIPIDELDIAKLNYDQEVKVSIDALEETEKNPIPGKIVKMPLEGTTVAGVTEYYVTIQMSGDERIRISMNASAKITTSSKKDVLVIPIDAIVRENGDTYVDVLLDDGIIERRSVELGDRNISYVEIKGGVNEGDRVIIPEISNGLF